MKALIIHGSYYLIYNIENEVLVIEYENNNEKKER